MKVPHAVRAPIVFAAVFVLARLGDLLGVRVAFCVVKALLGVPCPGCGVTTSIEALLRGRWAEALHANAAGPFVVAFVVVQLLVAWMAESHRLSGPAIQRASRLNDRVLATVLVAAWLIRIA